MTKRKYSQHAERMFIKQIQYKTRRKRKLDRKWHCKRVKQKIEKNKKKL